MALIRSHIKYFAWLLLPAFFLILNNSIRNRHSHILPGGLLIYHSHPLSNNNNEIPKGSHNHTKAEIILIQNFSIDYFEPGIELVCEKNYPHFIGKSASKTQDFSFFDKIHSEKLRAPPSKGI